ncbi:MAG: TadE/TadG family type IV pilus assembly protein [Streptosporangiaceae bacterium]
MSAPEHVVRAHRAGDDPRRVGRERGSFAIFVSIFSLFVILLAGLLVDGGLAIYARQRAADEAGQAARYAADDIDLAHLRSTGTAVIDRDACVRADDVIARYGDAKKHDCYVPSDGSSVTVSVTIEFKAQILGIIPGLGTFEVTSHATANPVSGI